MHANQKKQMSKKQLNKNAFKMVTIKIVSLAGHDEQELDALSALAEIQRQATEHGKWVYVDLERCDPDGLTIEDLVEADDITLTNALVGG